MGQWKSEIVTHTLCDLGRAIRRLDEDVAALRTESGRDGTGKGINTLEKRRTGLNAEFEILPE